MAETEGKKITAQKEAGLKASGFVFLKYFQNVFSVFLPKAPKDKNGKKEFNIKALNCGLFVFAVLLSLYYIKGISFSLNQIKNIDFGNFASLKGAEAVANEAFSLKPFSFYLESVKKRDIFRMGRKPPVEGELISSKAAEATQNLRVVGISWSEQPDAMIEDIKTGKTYFVKKGQIAGEFKVEAIYKDRVTLKSGMESIDIR